MYFPKYNQEVSRNLTFHGWEVPHNIERAGLILNCLVRSWCIIRMVSLHSLKGNQPNQKEHSQAGARD